MAIIQVILDEIKTYGNIIINQLYHDWTQPEAKSWKLAAQKNGISPIQCDRISGKNSTDIKMIVDLMHILYTVPSISLYYIVTSDSDYRHLIPFVKLYW